MKLLQLNAWGGRLEKQVLDLLLREKADIVCLQEIISLEGEGMFVTLEELQQACGYEYVYFSPVFSFAFMNREAHFGNAVLSHYPIKESHTLFTHLQHTTKFDYMEHDYNVRNLQIVSLDINDTELHVLNHHGHHVPHHKEGDAETLRQTALIAKEVSNIDGPLLLSGDFNLAPHSASLEQLNAQLRNLSNDAKLATTRTNMTSKTDVCDYIFINEKIHVLRFEAINDVVSDHKALFVEFTT